MNSRTVADVESWDRRSLGGALGPAADPGFSGAVRAGGTYCFVVAGRPVGVFDYREDPGGEPSVTPAAMEDVASPDEACAAPHDALPLLYAMQAAESETRGRYYSNDTPLGDVDRTLQDGGFTGYLELSENVLSGDYYLVYHGGTRRTVAFVGQSRRLKTDEEAFDLAADEVGIYTVERASLPRLSWPEGVEDGRSAAAGTTDDGADAGAGTAAGVGAVAGAGAAAGDSEPGDEDDTEAREAAAASGTREVDADPASPDPAPTASSTSDIDIDITPQTRREREAGGEGVAGTDADAGVEGAPAGERDAAGKATESGTDETASKSSLPREGSVEMNAPEATGTETTDPGPGAEPVESRSAPEGADGEPDAGGSTPPTADRQDSTTGARTAPEGDGDAIPAIVRVAESDEDTAAVEGAGYEASQADVAAATAAVDADEAEPAEDVPPDAPTASDQVVPSVDPERTARARPDPSGNGADVADDGEPRVAEDPGGPRVDTVIDGETVAGLRSELSERDAELAEREAELAELRERLETAETEKRQLRDRIEDLERRLEEAGAAPASSSRTLSPSEALDGTSLFVRYRSKRDATLDDLDGGVDPSDVAGNLRLEHHTQFDAEEVSVDGRAFDAFLEGTQGYAFVQWLVGSLPYEIRDTGNADLMSALYGALPAIDRVEFDGDVEVGGESVTFDVVARDRMGRPLVVANLEDVREPTDAATLGTLVNDATAVAEAHDSLAGSFAVTSAYFEPAALETANEATSGSLLSRSKRKSFVKLSRNQGFHLALVEDREESFYLSVPEL
jgi:flagellar motility protein MotE (MotC chaperone)